MSRNRRNQVGTVRFGPALKALGLCLFLSGSGVGYVWQKEQLVKLSDQLKQAEQRFNDLRHANEGASRGLAILQSQSYIESRIKQIDLGLVAPQPDQIVKLYESAPAADAPGKRTPALYAQGPRDRRD